MPIRRAFFEERNDAIWLILVIEMSLAFYWCKRWGLQEDRDCTEMNCTSLVLDRRCSLSRRSTARSCVTRQDHLGDEGCSSTGDESNSDELLADSFFVPRGPEMPTIRHCASPCSLLL
eukprot:3720052-Amphidinium_carterae.1